MRCPVCRAENAADAAACHVCGAALSAGTAEIGAAQPGDAQAAAPAACPQCGHENRPNAAYCGNCGFALAAGPPAGLADTGAAQPVEAAPLDAPAVEYMGFWIRVLALIIDSLILLVGQAVLGLILGDAGALGLVLNLAYYVLFTGLRGQTPGKMAVGITVIDEWGNVPGLTRALIREIPGKFLSGIALGLGFVWVAWDEKKQGWHDKIAKTYVVRKPRTTIAG